MLHYLKRLRIIVTYTWTKTSTKKKKNLILGFSSQNWLNTCDIALNAPVFPNISPLLETVSAELFAVLAASSIPSLIFFPISVRLTSSRPCPNTQTGTYLWCDNCKRAYIWLKYGHTHLFNSLRNVSKLLLENFWGFHSFWLYSFLGKAEEWIIGQKLIKALSHNIDFALRVQPNAYIFPSSLFQRIWFFKFFGFFPEFLYVFFHFFVFVQLMLNVI